MEKTFRIALWMVCLTGILQAKSIPKPLPFYLADLGFESLRNVTCVQNVTFTSPAKVQVDCHTAAVKRFKEGLEQAKAICTGDTYRIDYTLEALECNPQSKCCQPTPTTSSECKWETRKQFTLFVNDLEALVQQINSGCY